MANISTSIKNWSTTEASNQPDTTDAATIVGDMRAIEAGVRFLYSQDTIASATTCDLGSKDAESLTVSGSIAIIGLGTVSAGIVKRCVFSGVLTLTHNATSLILPGAANIITVAGDVFFFESLGAGNWRCILYLPTTGGAVTTSNTATLTNKTLTSPTINTPTINTVASVGGAWTAAAAWTLPAFTLGGTVTLNGQSFSGTCANGGTFTTIDINGGTVDGTVIGGASAAAGTFTTVAGTTSVLSSGSGGVGYATGAGGTVTQLTNKGTAVTLNNPCGQIVMNNAALAAGARVQFTFANSIIASTDNILIQVSGGGTGVEYEVKLASISTGSCVVSVKNISAGSLSEAIVLNFSVIKAVIA